MHILARFLPVALAFLKKWAQAIAAFILIQLKEWLASLKAWGEEYLRDHFLAGNPDAQDLLDFISLLSGRNSRFQEKIDAKLADAAGTMAEKKAALIARFDAQSDAFNRKHPVIWNEGYRQQLRSKLVDKLNEAEAAANRRLIDGAAAQVARAQIITQNLITRATNAVDRANVTRAEIAALRSPKFVGRSDTQVDGYLASVVAGKATHSYTREELDNEILGRKKGGKWNPHARPQGR